MLFYFPMLRDDFRLDVGLVCAQAIPSDFEPRWLHAGVRYCPSAFLAMQLFNQLELCFCDTSQGTQSIIND